jgi:ABC-type sugar transport system ATPase subunit
MSEVLLQLEGISKSFVLNKVLDSISAEFEKGKCYAVVGENGAGKSTLMKIIGGIYRPDAGRVLLEGRELHFSSASDAIAGGISIVHQELSLAGNLSVAQNIFCHREFVNGLGFIDWNRLYREAEKIFEQMGVKIDTRQKVAKLSVGMQQIIEIGKALSLKSKLIIMDEPTSALSEKEIDHLYEIISWLKERGVTVIFISHKLAEVFRIAQRIIVLRDGVLVGNEDSAKISRDEVISMMVGRHITDLFPEKSATRGEVIFEARNLSRKGIFNGITFDLREREILGFTGLVGAGRSEVARAIFGADKIDAGELVLRGKKMKIRSPREAIKRGICYLTEDRKGLGLFLTMKVKSNIVAAALGRFVTRMGFYLPRKIKQQSMSFVQAMEIRPFDDEINVMSLSGGNQQKTLLAKWLCAEPKLLIADEPTRGVDVGAKAKIHKDLRVLAESGVGVIVISSELPEILGLCDRIVVFREGTISTILENRDLGQEEVMTHATK